MKKTKKLTPAVLFLFSFFFFYNLFPYNLFFCPSTDPKKLVEKGGADIRQLPLSFVDKERLRRQLRYGKFRIAKQHGLTVRISSAVRRIIVHCDYFTPTINRLSGKCIKCGCVRTFVLDGHDNVILRPRGILRK